MVDLSFLAEDPTLQEMKRVTVAEFERQPRRTYLGMSEIGHPCERKDWLKYNNFPTTPRDWKPIWAATDGHRTEELIIQRLRMVKGIKIWDQQLEFADFDGKYQGHQEAFIEGLLQAPKTVHTLEVKTKNEASFNKLSKLIDEIGEKSALEKWDYTYFAQAQSLMKYGKTDRHYLVCATPGGRNVVSLRTEYNKEIADSLTQKAKRIIESKTVPIRITDNPDFHICRMCDVRDSCWGMQ